MIRNKPLALRAPNVRSEPNHKRASVALSEPSSEIESSTQSEIPAPAKFARKRLRAMIADAPVGREGLRYLVDLYYQIQDFRKAGANQERAAKQSGEKPGDFCEAIYEEMHGLEKAIGIYLDEATGTDPVGRWAKSITGIGPVISAGLLAHIDIHRAPTVGHIWRFAGLDPTMKWERKTKRPWNARLKVLCWHIGECFVKTYNNPDSFYGPIYVARKALEEARNEAGQFADQAAAALAAKKFKKETEARKWYEQGKLPPAHIHARAKRYAVKLFLSHYHHVAYESEFGQPPPKPYVIEHMGHQDLVGPPNWPVEKKKAA